MSIGNSQLSPCQEEKNLNESRALHAQFRAAATPLQTRGVLMDSKQSGVRKDGGGVKKRLGGDVSSEKGEKKESLHALYCTS